MKYIFSIPAKIAAGADDPGSRVADRHGCDHLCSNP